MLSKIKFLIFSFLFLSFVPLGYGQNMRMFQYTGAPSGGCQYPNMAQDIVAGKIYWCNNGTWTEISGGGGGGISGSLTKNQVAFGNTTANSIQGVSTFMFFTTGLTVPGVLISNSALGLTLADNLLYVNASNTTSRFIFDTGNIFFGCASAYGCNVGGSNSNQIGGITTGTISGTTATFTTINLANNGQINSDSFYFANAATTARIRFNGSTSNFSCATDGVCGLGVSSSDRWGPIFAISETITGGTFISTASATSTLTNQSHTPGNAALFFRGNPLAGYGTTNTKPLVLLEGPSATSTAWSNSGTWFGINPDSNFSTSGNIFDIQYNASSKFSLSSANGARTGSGVNFGVGVAPGNNTLSILPGGTLSSGANLILGSATLSSTAATQKGVSLTFNGGPTATTSYGVWIDSTIPFGYSLYVNAGTVGIAGQMQISNAMTDATGTPGSLCYDTTTFGVRKNNALTCTVSARKFKTEIVDIPLIDYDKLIGREFRYIDFPERKRYGFIADEVTSVSRPFGDNFDKNDDPNSIDANAILAVTVEEVKRLRSRVKELERR